MTASPKTLQLRLTCTQKACCGANKPAVARLLCSKNGSAAKSLILLGFQICTFLARSSQALDFPAFPGQCAGCYQQSYPQDGPFFGKALWNQGLTQAFAQ